jgi:hypothetical protein
LPQTTSSPSLSALLAYARNCLAADRYPGEHYPSAVLRCRDCGLVPLELTIEHHTGSGRRDFKGVIVGRCSACGREERVFSFTGEHRKPVREEKPVCRCGHAAFIVALVERVEGGDGLAGFFDEGVVVGACARCGRHTVFVYTD